MQSWKKYNFDIDNFQIMVCAVRRLHVQRSVAIMDLDKFKDISELCFVHVQINENDLPS